MSKCGVNCCRGLWKLDAKYVHFSEDLNIWDTTGHIPFCCCQRFTLLPPRKLLFSSAEVDVSSSISIGLRLKIGDGPQSFTMIEARQPIFLLHVCWKTGWIRVWWCRLQNVDQPWTKRAARWSAHWLLRAAHAQVPPSGNARRWGACCRKFA